MTSANSCRRPPVFFVANSLGCEVTSARRSAVRKISLLGTWLLTFSCGMGGSLPGMPKLGGLLVRTGCTLRWTSCFTDLYYFTDDLFFFISHNLIHSQTTSKTMWRRWLAEIVENQMGVKLEISWYHEIATWISWIWMNYSDHMILTMASNNISLKLGELSLNFSKIWLQMNLWLTRSSYPDYTKNKAGGWFRQVVGELPW